MAQSGYTPILIYASGTASAVPSAANLTSSANGAELALNYADGKLYYKNSSGVVTLLAQAGGTPAATPTTLGTVYGSMTTNSSTYLTAAGYNAGAGNTGNFNTAFGTLALDASPSGAANNAFGVSTLGSNTTGASNSGFGHNALASNTTGNYNVAVGHQALDNNDTASNNIAVGYQAMRSNTTANNNTAIGYQALYSNTTAVSNTAVGVQAGYTSNATAAPSNVGANVFVGSSAGYSATSAIHSVMIGAAAGYNVNTGSSNTLVGRLAGYNLTSGTFNTFVGPGDNNGGSGYLVSTGGKNTIIGAYSGNQGSLDIRTLNNYVVLSDGDGNPRMYFDTNGIANLRSSMLEQMTISATAATGTINFDAITQSVLYYTTNAGPSNFTMNVRGSSTVTLNNSMVTGQSLTIAFLCTNGATAYYQTAMTIDGSSVTPKWQGGTAPTSGNASSIDVYSYTIIKTGAATFTVLASQTKFA
jgi:hypothetical protein